MKLLNKEDNMREFIEGKIVQLTLLVLLVSIAGYAMFTGDGVMVDKILLAVFAGLELTHLVKK